MREITEKEIESLNLSSKDIIDALRNEFEEYGKGAVKNDPVEKVSDKIEGSKKVITILTKAHDAKYQLDKKIEETWEGNKKTDRQTIVTLRSKEGEEIFRYNGEYITNARTGASAALVASYLIPKNIPRNSLIVAIIGTGKVASKVVESIDELLSPGTIRFGTSNEASKERFANYIRGINKKVKVEGYLLYQEDKLYESEVQKLLNGAHVLIIADKLATKIGDKEKLLPLPYRLITKMHPSRHISALSGDAQQNNFEKEVLFDSWMVFDDLEKAKKTAEVRLLSQSEFGRLKIIGNVGDVVLEKGDIHRSDPTFYDSSGMGISDLTIAKLIAKYLKLI